MSKTKSSLYIDPKDLRLVLADLGRLGSNVTKKAVIRRALMKAGVDMKKSIERNAFNAIDDHGEMADSFAWRQGTVKRGYLSMFIRSIPSKGGKLTTIFENGTDDRYHKSGWWTGKIENGMGKTSGSMINTKFIQRGFDSNSSMTGASIVNQIKIEVAKVVRRSSKLNNK